MTQLGTVLPAATVAWIVGSHPPPPALGTHCRWRVRTDIGHHPGQQHQDLHRLQGRQPRGRSERARHHCDSALRCSAGCVVASGTAQRDAVQAAVRACASLQRRAGPRPGWHGCAGYDLYTEGGKITASPAQFALTNITTPACPKVAGGLDSTTGQASLSLVATVAACNSASMSANIPVGETAANWWNFYAYSDNFHPPRTAQVDRPVHQPATVQGGWL